MLTESRPGLATRADADDEEPREGRAGGSLKPVLDALPDSVYDNPTWKGLAYFGRDLVLYFGLVVALIFVSNVFGALALEVPLSLVVVGLFVVGHDSAHMALFKSKRTNSIVGHIAMLPSFHVFEGWIMGHNRIHHAFTVRQGYDFVWEPTTPEQYAAMGRFARLVHRVEWSFAGPGLYYLHKVWFTKMVIGKPPSRWVRKVRRDRFIVLGFALAATGLISFIGAEMTGTVAGTVWLVARVLLIPYLGFSYIAGSFVYIHHVHPDIRWWRKAEWTKFKAQMEGTTVLRAPKGLNFFIHWIMVHVPHHVDMRIPMYKLEEATEAIAKAFPGTVHDAPLSFRDFVSSTRQCKLYDYDAGRWLTYAQAGEVATTASSEQAA